MNISTWSDSEVMQLPDHLFGRRWSIPFSLNVAGGATSYQISPEGLGNRFVLWHIYADATVPVGMVYLTLRFAMGDQLPANAAAFNVLELIEPVRVPGPGAGAGWIMGNDMHVWIPLRNIYASAGRRLVVEITTQGGGFTPGMLIFVVSGVPMEIPEWYRSGMV